LQETIAIVNIFTSLLGAWAMNCTATAAL
jgi:hypothetical protein